MPKKNKNSDISVKKEKKYVGDEFIFRRARNHYASLYPMEEYPRDQKPEIYRSLEDIDPLGSFIITSKKRVGSICLLNMFINYANRIIEIDPQKSNYPYFKLVSLEKALDIFLRADPEISSLSQIETEFFVTKIGYSESINRRSDRVLQIIANQQIERGHKFWMYYKESQKGDFPIKFPILYEFVKEVNIPIFDLDMKRMNGVPIGNF